MAKLIGDERIHDDKIHAFWSSCVNGHLEVAKWLYSLDNTDLRDCDNSVFEFCCAEGHLEVAKWLYSLGNIDINANNGYVFRQSFKYNRDNIIRWLCFLEPRYIIEVNKYKKHT